MDITERKITKIAREAEKLVLLSLRVEGVGTAEIDLIHALREQHQLFRLTRDLGDFPFRNVHRRLRRIE